MPQLRLTTYFVLFAGLLWGNAEARAEKFKAILRQVDSEKRIVHVTRAEPADGREILYAVTPGARIIRGNGQKPLPDGLKDKSLVAGVRLTLTTQLQDGKQVVTKVAVYERAQKP